MAAQKVRLLVELTIHEGQYDAFDGIARDMTAGSKSEAGTLDYEWYLSADRRRCRLVESYVDSAALAKHFDGPVVQQLLPKLAARCTIDRIEAYGNLDQDIAATLAKSGHEIFPAWQGINR